MQARLPGCISHNNGRWAGRPAESVIVLPTVCRQQRIRLSYINVSSLRMQGSPESRLKYPEISARLQRVYFTLSFYTNSSPQLILHYSALQFFRDVRSGSVCCWQGYILVFEILIPIFRFEIEERSAKPLQLFQS